MKPAFSARALRMASLAMLAALLGACGVRTGSDSTPPVSTPPGGGGPGVPPVDRTLIWDQGNWDNNNWA
jgi:hypothetical protein